MLAEFGWVVFVWIIWMALFAITVALVRLAMSDQQATTVDLEAHVIAAQTGQSVDEARAALVAATGEAAAASGAASRINWRLKMPRRPAPPPPIGAS